MAHNHPEDLAWAAGFMDSGAQVGPWKRSIMLRIRRTDPEPLHRFRDIVGVGEVIQSDGGRWHYYIAGNVELARLAEQLLPWLGESRRRQLIELGVIRASLAHA